MKLTFVLFLTLVTIGCGAPVSGNQPAGNVAAGGVPAVVVPVLHSISISPKSVSLAVGGTQTYTAQGFDASGKQFPVSTVTWHSDNLNVASVSTSGSASAVASAIGEGTANITATASGVTSLNAAVVVSADASPVPAPIPTPPAPAPVVLTFAIAVTGSASSSFTVALGMPMGCYGAPLPSGVMYAGYYTTINFAGDVCFDASAFTNVSGAQPSLTYVGEGQGANPNVVNFAAIVDDAQQGSMLIVAQGTSTDGINYSGTWSTLWSQSGTEEAGSINAQMTAGAW